MSSNSLDQLHEKIKDKIHAVGSFKENKFYSWLIKSCQLRPFSYRKQNVSLEKKWFDSNNNILDLTEKPTIIFGSLEISYSEEIDLYKNSSFHELYIGAKLIFILEGKDEDLNMDHFVISFLGKDDKLRTFVYIYNNLYRKFTSLELGLEILKIIYVNRNIKNWISVPNIKNPPWPCKEHGAWLSCFPVGAPVSCKPLLDLL